MDAATHRVIEHVQGVLKRLHLADTVDRRLLLAVSGGADSMALAYVVSKAIGARRCYALTVDHGFRSESAREAKGVARRMRQLGIPHEIRQLQWGDNNNNADPWIPEIQKLEAVARERRYAAISNVCKDQGIETILTGHHAGDQAETFLLRFLRHSGVYGMGGMSVQAPLPVNVDNLQVVRPLLSIKKKALYGICQSAHIKWYEDASNRDPQFRRNQLRLAIDAHQHRRDSPINVDSLLEMSHIMQQHRSYINAGAEQCLKDFVNFDQRAGTAEIDVEWRANASLRERVLSTLIGWVGAKEHPPELAHIQEMLKATDSKNSSVAGVVSAGVMLLAPKKSRGWLLCRQPPRLGEIPAIQYGSLLDSPTTAVWDNRLKIEIELKGADIPWGIYTLEEAERRWCNRITSHRRWLHRNGKQNKKNISLAPRMVQLSMPVICLGDQPVYALGHVFDNAPANLSISIHMLRDPLAFTREVGVV